MAAVQLLGVHHVAIIASDYQRSRSFYVDLLGLRVRNEVYREERDSWMCDLDVGETYAVELFSFPTPPPRASWPEAAGLRHLAFAVEDVAAAAQELTDRGVECEPVRIDPYTGRAFAFFHDPDGLPLELYEVDRRG